MGSLQQERENIIHLENIVKRFNIGTENELEVLHGVSLDVYEGDFVCIVGESGSGKSTLMNQIGLLDHPTEGKYLMHGVDVSEATEDQLAEIRNQEIGFVFQTYNLIPNLTVRENIEVGAYLSDKALDVDELLKLLGLWEHRGKVPSQLSGGQQQRTAIGRAVVKNPDILLCDEPTGALDYKTSKEILKLIEQVNKTYGNTIIMVTHNDAIKYMADTVVRLKDGAIRDTVRNERRMSAEELEW